MHLSVVPCRASLLFWHPFVRWSDFSLFGNLRLIWAHIDVSFPFLQFQGFQGVLLSCGGGRWFLHFFSCKCGCLCLRSSIGGIAGFLLILAWPVVKAEHYNEAAMTFEGVEKWRSLNRRVWYNWDVISFRVQLSQGPDCRFGSYGSVLAFFSGLVWFN